MLSVVNKPFMLSVIILSVGRRNLVIWLEGLIVTIPSRLLSYSINYARKKVLLHWIQAKLKASLTT
jgi:hypothetical protein